MVGAGLNLLKLVRTQNLNRITLGTSSSLYSSVGKWLVVWLFSDSVNSVNLRTVEVGSDLWSASGPTPLLRQGHLDPVAQDCVQMAFEYLQGRSLCILLGQPIPALRHRCSQRVFPDVHRDPPVSQCVPVTPCPVTGRYWKEPGSVLFVPSLQVSTGGSTTSNHWNSGMKLSFTIRILLWLALGVGFFTWFWFVFLVLFCFLLLL